MNNDMKQKILNMKIFVNNTREQCHYAALADDGKVNEQELKNLRILDTATEKFMKALSKIK